ncbi:MAG: DUF4136 domain-containing protein [Pseudomonadota bacterium]
MALPKPITAVLLALVCLLAQGCTTIDDIISSDVKVDHKKDYDFRGIERVSVSCNADRCVGEQALPPETLERIDQSVRTALEGRGLEVVDDAAAADVQVSWYVVVQETSNVREYNAEAYYQCWRCGPAISNTVVETFTAGTFIVDMIDPSLSKSVWRGVMQGRLAGVSNPNVQQQRLDQAARQMFSKFPPGILIDGVF